MHRAWPREVRTSTARVEDTMMAEDTETVNNVVNKLFTHHFQHEFDR